MTASRVELRSLEELYTVARATLDGGAWSYLDGGAGGEATVAFNRAGFRRWHLLPRPLSGITSVETTASLMGVPLSVPFVAGPVGTYSAFHEGGDVAVARAAERFGTLMIVPVLSAFPLEETARQAPGGARIFQALASGTEERFLELAQRAARCGYSALCLTIDAYPRSVRDRLASSGFDLPLEALAGNYGAAMELEDRLHVSLSSSAWSWAMVKRLIAEVELPVMIKGVLTAETARAALDAGAVAIMVSNVGGRQLDGAPSAIAQLPSIVDAVGGQIEIAFDSGVRRGTDIFKALALGANVVSLGRATAMGLAADGEAGVLTLLELLRDELTTVMALCGARNIAEIDQQTLQPAEPGPTEHGPDTR